MTPLEQQVADLKKQYAYHTVQVLRAYGMVQPAIRLEECFDLTGIAGHYQLPEMMTSESLQLFCAQRLAVYESAVLLSAKPTPLEPEELIRFDETTAILLDRLGIPFTEIPYESHDHVTPHDIINGASPEVIEVLVREAHEVGFPQAAKLLAHLIALNPSLERFAGDAITPREAFIVVAGVTSGYNPDDIAYFLGRTRAYQEEGTFAGFDQRVGILYREQEREVCRMLGISELGWLCDQLTMNTLYRQVLERSRRNELPDMPGGNSVV